MVTDQSAAALLVFGGLVGFRLEVDFLFLGDAPHLDARVLSQHLLTSFLISITPFSIFSSRFSAFFLKASSTW